jgi:hypothetical protein
LRQPFTASSYIAGKQPLKNNTHRKNPPEPTGLMPLATAEVAGFIRQDCAQQRVQFHRRKRGDSCVFDDMQFCPWKFGGRARENFADRAGCGNIP